MITLCMILITVTDVQTAEGSRGKFLITVKLSTGQHEEVRTFPVFRYFLKNPVFEGSWEEDWTLRKLLRRFIWHDRIHARAMERMRKRTFGV